jgi:hypothetical protein
MILAAVVLFHFVRFKTPSVNFLVTATLLLCGIISNVIVIIVITPCCVGFIQVVFLLVAIALRRIRTIHAFMV